MIKANIHFEDETSGEIIVPLDHVIQHLLYNAYHNDMVHNARMTKMLEDKTMEEVEKEKERGVSLKRILKEKEDMSLFDWLDDNALL